MQLLLHDDVTYETGARGACRTGNVRRMAGTPSHVLQYAKRVNPRDKQSTNDLVCWSVEGLAPGDKSREISFVVCVCVCGPRR